MSPDHLDWTEKFRPVSLSDVLGNEAAVKALRQWADTFGTGKRAVILYGSPGTGKTSAALALAHDLGWDYIEMNASDQRNKNVVQQIAGTAAKAGTFEGTAGRRLIILDEADNLQRQPGPGRRERHPQRHPDHRPADHPDRQRPLCAVEAAAGRDADTSRSGPF